MKKSVSYDKIIIGAGLYGLYSALFCGKRGQKVLVLEHDDAPFKRATYINQARVHNGYHYPRSLTTAAKSASYFKRFNDDFGFCIHSEFDQIYALSSKFSWTDAARFKDFCDAAGIFCSEVPAGRYFQDGMCEGAFLTREYTYDAYILRDHLISEIKSTGNVEIEYNVAIESIKNAGNVYEIILSDGSVFSSGFVLNATYASVNQILDRVEGLPENDRFDLKYELCEIILCKASKALKGVGITVMDGPFFSIMPFGKTGLHSLTAVTFTPHTVSYDSTPTFSCSDGSYCSAKDLGNCNDCPNRPKTSWQYMSHLADKYLLSEYSYEYDKSLFSMKPILKSSEVDDSRPTCIKVHSEGPTLISVLSGKINTVYDLDKYLIR